MGAEAAELIVDELVSLDRQQRARSHDIELLRHEMAAGFAQLRAELHEQLNEQNRRIDAQTRQLGFWILGALAAMAGINLGAAGLS